MSINPMPFVESAAFVRLSSDAVKVYLFLRNSVFLGKSETTRKYASQNLLVADPNVQLIALGCSASTLVVTRAIDELLRAGWMVRRQFASDDFVTVLGEIVPGGCFWYADACKEDRAVVTQEARPHSAVDALRQKLAGDVKLLQESASRRVARKSGGSGLPTAEQRKILMDTGLLDDLDEDVRFAVELFEELHKRKYACSPQGYVEHPPKARIVARGKLLTCGNSLMRLCGSRAEATRYLEYVVENWEALRKNVFKDFQGVTPTLAFIANEAVFRKIRGCMVGGVPAEAQVAADKADRAGNKDWSTVNATGWGSER